MLDVALPVASTTCSRPLAGLRALQVVIHQWVLMRASQLEFSSPRGAEGTSRGVPRSAPRGAHPPGSRPLAGLRALQGSLFSAEGRKPSRRSRPLAGLRALQVGFIIGFVVTFAILFSSPRGAEGTSRYQFRDSHRRGRGGSRPLAGLRALQAARSRSTSRTGTSRSRPLAGLRALQGSGPQ